MSHSAEFGPHADGGGAPAVVVLAVPLADRCAQLTGVSGMDAPESQPSFMLDNYVLS
ncbi:hypothetical protein ACIHDR_04790 [Nocardia sp. NPDC052278]|uniref:hypothetical protein n=1 Tax=unclassified Nocardia TaxID=2637762 RepID=UPI00368A182C